MHLGGTLREAPPIRYAFMEREDTQWSLSLALPNAYLANLLDVPRLVRLVPLSRRPLSGFPQLFTSPRWHDGGQD